MTIKVELQGYGADAYQEHLWSPAMLNVDQLLIIAADRRDSVRYQGLLKEAGHQGQDVLTLASLEEAYEYLLDHSPRCCLIDYLMPDGTARDLLSRLNRNMGMPAFPIVVTTESCNQNAAIELMHLGVQDFLVKDSMTGPLLRAALDNAVNSFAMKYQLQYMSHYDALTGVLNRSLFLNRLEHAIAEAKRYNRTLQLFYLDIDYFQQINETYGHAVGDTLLTTVAGRIKQCIRETDSIGRISGDEFALLLTEATVDDARVIAGKLLDSVGKPVRVGELILQTNLSIGISSFPDTADDHNDLMQQATNALKRAKESGRSRYLQFTRHHSNVWKRKISLSKALPRALQDRELCLAYQPIFSTNSDEPFSIETLVRWHFQGQWVEPGEIMAMVQQCGLQINFHDWLFNQALGQLRQWQNVNPDLSMAINLPGDIIQNQIILESLFESVERYDLDPQTVVLEITEINLMQEPDYIRRILDELACKGFRIAIDNFGTGFSSMEFLADLPCHILKIDKSFFHNLDTSSRKLKMIDAITALGHRLGLKVVAEGIENARCAELATQAGCDSNQGFWYGRPVLGEPDLENFLRKSKEFCGQIAPDLDYVSH